MRQEAKGLQSTYTKTFSGYDKADRLVRDYPVGRATTCYVDPSDPSESVLIRNSLWICLGLPFPLIFVAVGAGGLFFVWRKSESKPSISSNDTGGREERPNESISSRASKGKRRERAILLVVFSLFLLLGLGILYPFFLRPLSKTLDSRDWPPTPCTVVSSRVRTHEGDDGDTYSVDILYEYEVAGRSYRSNRYSFFGGSSSGYQGKARIVREHPPGTKTVCYVNPADPREVVLNPRLTPVALIGLVPLAFVLVGGGGLIGMARGAAKRRRPDFRRPGAVVEPRVWGGASDAARAAEPRGPGVLKPGSGRVGKLFVMLFVAIFWNGIVSIFVTIVVKSWMSGHPEYFLTLFIIPFVVIGLLIVWGVIHSLLSLFNPSAELRLSERDLRVGDSVEIEWRILGNAARLLDFSIVLVGREEATYTRGTDQVTDRSVFARIPIVETSSRADILSGHAKLAIPSDTMHSFTADHNKIVWTLRVKGTIDNWPDLDDEYAVTLGPSRPVKGIHT